MAVWRRGTLRLPQYNVLDLLNRSNSLKIICKRCASQAQTSEDRKSRSMVGRCGLLLNSASVFKFLETRCIFSY